VFLSEVLSGFSSFSPGFQNIINIITCGFCGRDVVLRDERRWRRRSSTAKDGHGPTSGVMSAGKKKKKKNNNVLLAATDDGDDDDEKEAAGLLVG
jgi:hypothetical protein